MSSPAPNADPAEIEKFNQLASRWWDPDGDFRPLHELNPIRLEFIQRHADLTGCRALDVGCGGGILSESLARAGATVTGIDMADDALAVARLHADDNGLDIAYECSTAEEFAPDHAGRFDVVACMELLEHVPDPGSLVRACAAAARPGGYVFFSTINRSPKAYALAVVSAEYVMRLLPRGTHDYERFIRPSELAGLIRAAGLSVEAIAGLRYDPVRGVHGLTDRPDVNYVVAARRPSEPATS